MEARNVLIFPAGTEIAFEIVNALKYSKFVNIFGGTSVNDHSEFVYNNLITGFPYIDDEDFLTYLNSMIAKYDIDCVYPAHDSVSVFLSDNSDKINAQVIITDRYTTGVCRSKARTYELFKYEDFVPRIYDKTEIESITEYPVFVKPDVGQGSVGARRIDNLSELEAALSVDKSLVICEYLSEMEYTVDCFTDKDGNLRVCNIRDRQRIRSGISVRSKSLDTEVEVKRIVSILNNKLTFKGAWFFQLKKNTVGQYKLLEISPRIPGTMGLSRNRGINFPMLTLFTFWGYDVDIIDNQYDIILDRAFYNAYKVDYEYDDIYLDFDDTLIIKDKVNQDVMRFIYQSVNEGKRIHLLSKHTSDIYEDLKKYKISELIFDTIKVIPREEEKYHYIKKESAIFIDDSFAERKKVRDMLGIAVFDVDMIESLVNYLV